MVNKRECLLKYIESLTDSQVDSLYDSFTQNNSTYDILLPFATYLNMYYTDAELTRLSESMKPVR